MKPIYLDYSATTPVKPEVLAAMLPYFSEQFGNPSSLYGLGFASKDAIDQARGQVAALIGAEPREIYFTSGGTEADNWAVVGAARARRNKGNHIITSKIEHHALLHTCKALEKEGFEVTYLDVDEKGFVKLKDLKDAINERTILISIMFANNEVGTLQPIREIGEIARAYGILFHTDAVQALGNVPIDVRELNIDLMSVSAHKIYGPKGIGALFIRKGLVIENLLQGGGQENKRRAGTENLTGIVGFGKAAELAGNGLAARVQRIRDLREYFLAKLQERIDDIAVNGDRNQRLPGNLNVIFHYIEGEALLLHLDIRGICASTGSACSSASFSPSHVLSAMGLPLEKVYSSLRFTVGDPTTKEEIDTVVEALSEIVTKLRVLSPFDKDHQMESTQVLRHA